MSARSDAPILLVIDLVDLQVVGIELNCEVAVQGRIVEEIRFDDLGLITKAEDEGFKAMMRNRCA